MNTLSKLEMERKSEYRRLHIFAPVQQVLINIPTAYKYYTRI